MELVKVGEKTYYIKNQTNIGIYKIKDNEVYLIDSGNDKDAGKKILKIIEEQGWCVKAIINTHSHADHIGGNNIIQERTNCKVYAHGIEKAFIENPILEPIYLWGGYPICLLKENKFLMAKPSKVEEIVLPEGLEMFSLKGHYIDMIGIKTSDEVYFLADAVLSEELVEKHKIFFLYDVAELLKTLEQLEHLEGKLYIPSHAEATKDLKPMIQKNRQKIEEVIQNVLTICQKPKTFEEILQEIFEKYNMKMNENQYVLIGSTIRCYITYLCNENRLQISFDENKMKYQIVEE